VGCEGSCEVVRSMVLLDGHPWGGMKVEGEVIDMLFCIEEISILCMI
jgi:hypothetical protein